jgi:hypothetical protein
MALMPSRLYDALRSANVPKDKAREAAEEVATYEQVTEPHLCSQVDGRALGAIVLGVFWLQWQTVIRISDLQGGLGEIDSRLANVDGRSGGMGNPLRTTPSSPAQR